MIRAAAGGIERKTSLGRFSQCNLIAHLKWVCEQARRVYYGAVFKVKKDILGYMIRMATYEDYAAPFAAHLSRRNG